MITGGGVPKICVECTHSYWEDMCYGEDESHGNIIIYDDYIERMGDLK